MRSSVRTFLRYLNITLGYRSHPVLQSRILMLLLHMLSLTTLQVSMSKPPRHISDLSSLLLSNPEHTHVHHSAVSKTPHSAKVTTSLLMDLHYVTSTEHSPCRFGFWSVRRTKRRCANILEVTVVPVTWRTKVDDRPLPFLCDEPHILNHD